MREIKFRAWDRVAKKFLLPYPDGFHILGETTCFDLMGMQLKERSPDKSVLELINDVEIIQYTGLKDKNGVEIYEGDVVQWNAPYGSIAEVKFGVWDNGIEYDGREGGYGWYTTFDYIHTTRRGKEYKHTQAGSLLDSYFEVIGNIYENGDLLNEVD